MEPKTKEQKSNKIKSFKDREQTGGYRPERDERGKNRWERLGGTKFQMQINDSQTWSVCMEV